MREIKFRAWDGEQMIDKWLWAERQPEQDVGIVMLPPYWRLGYDSGTALEVMQYTGLKDSAGTDIYEGDIVTAGGLVCLVVWHKVGWAAQWKDDRGMRGHPDLGFRAHEVIGNIHQHAELLEDV